MTAEPEATSGETIPAHDGVCDNCRDPSCPSVQRCDAIRTEPHTHPASLHGPSIPCGLELCARCARSLAKNLPRWVAR